MMLKNGPRLSRVFARRISDQGLVDTPLQIPTGKSDMDYKTRVSFLSQDMEDTERTGIRGISAQGFRMYDGSFLYGPIVVFPTIALSWRVPKAIDITPESLKIFFMLQPKPDVVVLGVGAKKNIDLVKRQIGDCFQKHRIGLELAPTEDAIPTFNFLNFEYRTVGGAFFPTEDLEVSRGEHSRSLSMVHHNYDRVTDPPHHMLTNIVGDTIEFSLSRMYGHNTKEAHEAREFIDEIRAEDLKMKEAKLQEKRLRLESITTPVQFVEESRRNLKQLEGPDEYDIVGEKAKKNYMEKVKKQKELEDK